MVNITNIILTAQRICLNVVEPRLNNDKSPEEQKHGGFLCVVQGTNLGLPPVAMIMIGGPRLSKQAKYAELSKEKARRLAGFPLAKSSWQSRNPSIDCWGGAVRCKDKDGIIILSFSGLTEEADEALVLLVAVLCNLLTREEAAEIARISNNELYKEIGPAF